MYATSAKIPSNAIAPISDRLPVAAVAGTGVGAMHAIASNNIQKHVIGLIPATDNRPSGNAYAPGDVVTMFNKLTVEVLNTDAEGRMILADALSYADKYKPELVIDLATLTGAAARAIGHFGIVSMQKNAEKYPLLFKILDQKNYGNSKIIFGTC